MSYPGGKNGGGAFQKIINQIPPHRVYIEAFVGSGAVLRNKRPAEVSYAIDLDPAVIEALTVRAGPIGELADSTRLDPDGSAADLRRRSVETPSEAADLRRRSVETPSEESADSPTRDLDGGSAAAAETVTGQALLLPRVRAGLPSLDRSSASSPPTAALGICADAITWLASYKWKGEEFVYADPPYLGVTRRGQSKQVYPYEMIEEREHTQLLNVLLAIPCPVMVSGYWSALYGRKLAAWRTVRFQAMTRGGVKAAEVLWMNYSEPLELHDYRYLGENSRQRQDIKRMKARWLKKLVAMPAVKRYAILSALGEGMRCSSPYGSNAISAER